MDSLINATNKYGEKKRRDDSENNPINLKKCMMTRKDKRKVNHKKKVESGDLTPKNNPFIRNNLKTLHGPRIEEEYEREEKC